MNTSLPDYESESLIIGLFQALPEMMADVAPSGFTNSELIYVFHPTKEQQYKEYCNIPSRFQDKPIKSCDQFIIELEDSEIEEEYEIISIYGDCIWDIFSNNHTVYNQNLESYDLGSFRGSGRFIADVIDKMKLIPEKPFNYMDFYMGSFVAEQRANLVPVYEFIFKKLKSKKIDWEYYFPRIGIVNFDNPADEDKSMKDYDPGISIQKQLEKEQKKEEVNKLRKDIDNIYKEEFDKAHYSAPAQVVQAYYQVYGHWPKGHPLSKNDAE